MTHTDELDLLASDTLATLGEPCRLIIFAAPTPQRTGQPAMAPVAAATVSAVITDRGEFGVAFGSGGGAGSGGLKGHAAMIVVKASDVPDAAKDAAGGVRQGSIVRVEARAGVSAAKDYKVASSRTLIGGRQIAMSCAQVV